MIDDDEIPIPGVVPTGKNYRTTVCGENGLPEIGGKINSGMAAPVFLRKGIAVDRPTEISAAQVGDIAGVTACDSALGYAGHLSL